jgi:hypothetical protein
MSPVGNIIRLPPEDVRDQKVHTLSRMNLEIILFRKEFRQWQAIRERTIISLSVFV